MAVGLPAALSTQLILVVDLGTELVPAISLAYEVIYVPSIFTPSTLVYTLHTFGFDG